MDVVQLSGPVMFSGAGRCQIKLEAVDLVVCGKKQWSREWELNPRPVDYESTALPLSYLGPFLTSHSTTDFYFSSLAGALRIRWIIGAYFENLEHFFRMCRVSVQEIALQPTCPVSRLTRT